MVNKLWQEGSATNGATLSSLSSLSCLLHGHVILSKYGLFGPSQPWTICLVILRVFQDHSWEKPHWMTNIKILLVLNSNLAPTSFFYLVFELGLVPTKNFFGAGFKSNDYYPQFCFFDRLLSLKYIGWKIKNIHVLNYVCMLSC